MRSFILNQFGQKNPPNHLKYFQFLLWICRNIRIVVHSAIRTVSFRVFSVYGKFHSAYYQYSTYIESFIPYTDKAVGESLTNVCYLQCVARVANNLWYICRKVAQLMSQGATFQQYPLETIKFKFKSQLRFASFLIADFLCAKLSGKPGPSRCLVEHVLAFSRSFDTSKY